MDDGLKQRLIGAIVLLAIAVLFLPGLFSRDARRTVDLTSQIPSEPPAVAEFIQVPEPVQPEDIPAAKPLAENYPHTPVEEPEAEPEAETRSELESEEEAIATAPESQAPPALSPEGVPEGWSLQVASFQSSERALALRERLIEAGYKSYTREGSAGQNTVHRVFVGPKIDKAMAEAEKRSIDERFKTDALIVEFKP